MPLITEDLEHETFKMEISFVNLNVKAFALTCALVWGFGLFVLTWWIIAIGGVTGEATLIGRLYLGYNISPLGSVLGLIWAFADGFVGGAVFAWLYNLLVKRLSSPRQAKAV
jgi:hypothetical protein